MRDSARRAIWGDKLRVIRAGWGRPAAWPCKKSHLELRQSSDEQIKEFAHSPRASSPVAWRRLIG